MPCYRLVIALALLVAPLAAVVPPPVTALAAEEAITVGADGIVRRQDGQMLFHLRQLKADRWMVSRIHHGRVGDALGFVVVAQDDNGRYLELQGRTQNAITFKYTDETTAEMAAKVVMLQLPKLLEAAGASLADAAVPPSPTPAPTAAPPDADELYYSNLPAAPKADPNAPKKAKHVNDLEVRDYGSAGFVYLLEGKKIGELKLHDDGSASVYDANFDRIGRIEPQAGRGNPYVLIDHRGVTLGAISDRGYVYCQNGKRYHVGTRGKTMLMLAAKHAYFGPDAPSR